MHANWSMHPVTLRQPTSDAKTMSVWIGLRNERPTAQMVCVASEGYIIGTMPDPYVFATGEVHACRGDDVQFTIVRPGETYFYGMTMDLRKDWQKGPLELSLFLEDFDDSGEGRSSQVKWNGKVSSLVEAGMKVMPKSPPPR